MKGVFALMLTAALLLGASAAAEKRKVLEVYDPSCHHYEADPPTWTEIEPGHFVLANQEELEKYRTMI